MANRVVSLFVACLMFCGASVAEPFAIHLDPSKDFIRDLRDTSAAPVLGYAGSMLEFNDSLAHVLWHDCSDDLATALRDGGARLVKEWNSLDKWQIGMAYAQAKSAEERASLRKRFGRSEGLVDDPKVWFSFRKKHGMKVFICLEQYRVWTDVAQGVRTNEIGIVKKAICDYLRWILHLYRLRFDRLRHIVFLRQDEYRAHDLQAVENVFDHRAVRVVAADGFRAVLDFR